MKNVLYVVLIFFSLSACQKTEILEIQDEDLVITESSSEEEDGNIVSHLYKRVEDMSKQVKCEDPSTWKFTGIGTAICGGPATYIGYSSEIDEDVFLSLVDRYTVQKNEYRRKWANRNIAGHCAITPAPTSLDCENGEVVLVYDR